MSANEADAPLVRAISALERSRLKLEAIERERIEPIAIIGAACRLPGGVTDIESFWALLDRGGDAVSEFPETRWGVSGLLDANRAAVGKIYSGAMAVLEGADRFDAAAFGITAREAERMDPQQRQLLEVSFEAIEHAGLSVEALRGTDTGVFLGICESDFTHRFPMEDIDTYTATGSSIATASGRLSYTFDFQGPALSVDTACSSSLVAVHLACQSLRRKEAGLAVVGGVHVTAGPETSIAMAKLNALSPTGRCRTFSADADGYVRGEGCIVLVLKRLSDALKEGDRILGSIRATVVNQDGRSNGLTAPSRLAQAALLRSCLFQAKVQPRDVAYLEAHGTGTELGDPIELAAVAAVYGVERDTPLWVGSGKTNMGHLEAAAGLLGLLRAVLALRHRTIPPNLHLRRPNPHFDWDSEKLRVAVTPTPFPINQTGSRMAGVSSFGFSGTNAHVLVEQAPQSTGPNQLPIGVADWAILSADSEAGLQEQARRVAGFLRSAPDRWRDLCYTTRFRRNRLPERLAVVGCDVADVAERLDAFAQGATPADVVRGRCVSDVAGVVAVFPGQGGHWAGMGRELYESSSVFTRVFDECSAAVDRYSDYSMCEALHAVPDDVANFNGSIMQPLSFALAVALAAHMRALGVRFDATVGHSAGEVAAAVVSGALSLDDGAQVICTRSRLCAGIQGSSMAMVALSEDEIETLARVEGIAVTVAAINGPFATVVSGHNDAVDDLVSTLQTHHVFCRKVRIDYASHSAFVDPLLAPLKEQLTGISPRATDIPLYSAVTADEIDGRGLTPDYWAANLRRPVRFHQAIQKLIQKGFSLFLEIGPRPTLQSSIDDALLRANVTGCVVSAMRENEPQCITALKAAAKLHVHGADIRVEPAPARVTELPTRPWQHKDFPLPKFRRDVVPSRHEDALLGRRHAIAGFPGTWVSDGVLSIDHDLVGQHRLNGGALLPAAGFLRMAIEAAQVLWPGHAVGVVDAKFKHALSLRSGPNSPTRALQLVVVEEARDTARWRVSSCADEHDEGWTDHASGIVTPVASLSNAEGTSTSEQLKTRMHGKVDGMALYDELRSVGFEYGSRFRAVQHLWWSGNEFLARLATPSDDVDRQPSAFMLDAALHGLAWLGAQAGEGVRVPIAVSRLSITAEAGAPTWVHGVRSVDTSSRLGDASSSDLVMWDDKGRTVARMTGLRAVAPKGLGAPSSGFGQWVHGQTWIEQPASGLNIVRPCDWLVVASERSPPKNWLDRLRTRLGGAELLLWDRAGGQAFPQAGLNMWVRANGRPAQGIIYVGSSVGSTGFGAEEGIDAEASIGTLSFVQAVLAACEGREPPRVAFVSAGTQTVGDEAISSCHVLGDASLWGFFRALSAEHAELRCRCIDMASDGENRQIDLLADELLGDSHETEVALRAERWVGRLSLGSLPAERGAERRLSGEPYRLEIDEPGLLSSLTLRVAPRVQPVAGQVEVEVEAAALNFADVMRAMGFFVGDDELSVSLGTECVGIVSRVAADVTTVRVGQRVVAIGSHCFASHANVDAAFVVPFPERLSIAQAAGAPIASMTACYALQDVAAIRAGQRVLIHSASGGTGMAAVQLAFAIGAEVIATAGTEAKRQMLREMGVRHVFDSRSDAFEGQTLDATGGIGVQVVLNSLAGRAVEQNLRVLDADGWFLELGKRDIYDDGRLPLRYFKKRIRFAAIDLGGLQRDRPQQFSALFKRVMTALQQGTIAPVQATILPISRAHDAFHQMAAAQHVGKLVLDLRERDVSVAEPSGPAPLLRGTQIVTGGTGGLGCGLAAWLAEHGARRLVLMGRSAPDASTSAKISLLQQRGVEVHVVAVDVGSRAELARVMQVIATDSAPVRGVFHLAGVLKDGLLETQTPDDFRRVLRPKVDGAWNLHELTARLELDHFVLYSSAASLLPSPSQANYSAANAFLDALASYRRAIGLPALSVQWGPFSDIGLAAASKVRGERLSERGVASMTSEQSLRYLGTLMKCAKPVVGVFPFDRARWLASSPAVAAQSRFDLLRSRRTAHHEPAPSDALKAMPPSLRFNRILALILHHTAAVLRVQESAVLPELSFQQIGMDSLTGLELRNRIENEMDLRLSSADLWRHPTVKALADSLVQRMAVSEEHIEVSIGSGSDKNAARANAGGDNWFLVPRKSDAPRLRLFCIPFLGGKASMFSEWVRHLPAAIELQALQLPGRPPRHHERTYAQFWTLVDALCDALLPRLDVPYALYGHCSGALLAFGVAQALREKAAPPMHLFLAAHPAPHLHNPVADLAGLPEAEFIEGLTCLGGIPEQVLADRELLSVFLPNLYAEVDQLKSYSYVPHEPLAMPATIFGGRYDDLVGRDEIAAWRQHFSGPVEIREVDSGHYFLRDVVLDVVADLSSGFLLSAQA